jgi:hypothetical protein
MGKPNTVDEITAGLKPVKPFFKNSLAAVAGRMFSMWTAAGNPGAGVAPGAAAVANSSTPGAFPLDAIAGSEERWLAALSVGSGAAALWQLLDRLVHSSGLNATLNTAQTVNTPALTRAVSGAGVLGFIEVYTPLGATAVTATVSYTNHQGTAGRVGTASIAASAAAGSLFPIAMQAGDFGIRSIQSVTLSATTGTAGNFGVTLAKPLSTIGNLLANTSQDRDAFSLVLAQIEADACLMLAFLATTTSSGLVLGTYAATVKA